MRFVQRILDLRCVMALIEAPLAPLPVADVIYFPLWFWSVAAFDLHVVGTVGGVAVTILQMRL